tara:strand:+ start:709 stop:813 length:105 start_codon:yes stop_codon:yes gene_type:complete
MVGGYRADDGNSVLMPAGAPDLPVGSTKAGPGDK